MVLYGADYFFEHSLVVFVVVFSALSMILKWSITTIFLSFFFDCRVCHFQSCSTNN